MHANRLPRADYGANGARCKQQHGQQHVKNVGQSHGVDKYRKRVGRGSVTSAGKLRKSAQLAGLIHTVQIILFNLPAQFPTATSVPILIRGGRCIHFFPSNLQTGEADGHAPV
jgi:hypothetical protein